jgi:hypothetical protein
MYVDIYCPTYFEFLSGITTICNPASTYICIKDYPDMLFQVLMVHLFSIGYSVMLHANLEQRKILFDLFVKDVCSREVDVAAFKKECERLRAGRVFVVGPDSKRGLFKKTTSSSKKSASAPKQHEDTVINIDSESESLGVSKPKQRRMMFREDTFSNEVELSERSGSENLYSGKDEQ